MGWQSCTCDECKDRCKRPCWPTPEEAQALVDAGFGGRFMHDYWGGDGYDGGDIDVLCPALIGYEGRSAPFVPFGLCTFQDERGLCELHDLGLKPYEGRMVMCDGSTPENMHKDVAQMWNNPQAQALVSTWLKGGAK